MKEYDEINDYLELDDTILNDIINDDDDDDEIEEYSNSAIYIIHYPKPGEEAFVSYGMIKGKYIDEKYIFNHDCSTGLGSSGSPILYLNNKVIGIHLFDLFKHRKYHNGLGNFLKYPIKEFIQQNKNMNKKEIATKENIQKKDLSIQDRPIEKFNLIRKHLGLGIFIELDELYFSYKISFFFSGMSIIIRPCYYFLDLETCKNLINQAENYIYKIKVGNKEGIGFICIIPINNKKNMITVLITNNNIINEELLNKKDGKILIDIKEEKTIKAINLLNRRKYTSKEYNISIIEIKKEDEIKNYLELDDRIIDVIVNIEKKNDEKYFLSKFYSTESFYMIGFSKVIYGLFKANEDKCNFVFPCDKKNYQLGIPVFLTRNSKLVGYYYKKYFNKNFEIGTFLNYPIKEYIKTNYK